MLGEPVTTAGDGEDDGKTQVVAFKLTTRYSTMQEGLAGCKASYFDRELRCMTY